MAKRKPTLVEKKAMDVIANRYSSMWHKLEDVRPLDLQIIIVDDVYALSDNSLLKTDDII